ncbi:hypothetical protein RKE29_22440 [Streptomyces sp. B1866]|uniref:hypothetical protein n=1 Tax=Streptomyces sp. B1866 TaxID=3075431 RepID=UPI0028908434|nr:hypothetical protein [Streptomyces sp. B1866]MDT3399371.1 hypothetical protein [Streptomyces sp. B1866]
MKRTMIFGSIANPRRTRLAHLKDGEGIQKTPEELPQGTLDLPATTANPKRTILMEAPGA